MVRVEDRQKLGMIAKEWAFANFLKAEAGLLVSSVAVEYGIEIKKLCALIGIKLSETGNINKMFLDYASNKDIDAGWKPLKKIFDFFSFTEEDIKNYILYNIVTLRKVERFKLYSCLSPDDPKWHIIAAEKARKSADINASASVTLKKIMARMPG